MKIQNLVAVLVSASFATACAYHNPTAPTRDTTPTAGTPASLALSVTSGIGPNGGTARVDAMVRDGQFNAVSGVTVAFAAASGTISGEAFTNDKGIASAILTAAPGSVLVTARLGAIQSTALVAVQTPTAPPPTPTPPPPTSNPNPDPGPLSISLSASGATLGDQNTFSINAKNPSGPITVAWVFGDGTTANSTSTTTAHRYAAVGTYTASATLRDDAGRSASASTPVTVFASVPTPAPTPFYTVTVVASPTSVTSGGTSTLTATAVASNGAPTPTAFDWDCDGNGTIESTTAANTFACSYTAVGTTTSRVTVTGGAATGTGTTPVTVTAITLPPLVVGVTTSSFTPAVGANVTFTATVTSTGSVPATLQWQWDDTNDGNPEVVIASAASPNVRTTAYGSSGVKTVKVTVTDPATGRTASGLLTVTVS